MMDLLRSPAVAVDSARWHASGPRRVRRAISTSLCILALYGSASLFSLLTRSPFQVAVERARTLGGWDADQVHFEQGHYGYRFLYSVAWADLEVDTPEGRRPVRIRMRNDPFSGWRVQSLNGQPVDPGVRLTSTF